MYVLNLLANVGAVTTDRHFVYTSGKHGPAYINMDYLFPDINVMKEIALRLGLPWTDTANVVIGAATGGIPLAVLTAAAMPHSPFAVWADKCNGGFEIGRAGFAQILDGANVLVVEDLLNTGSTTSKIIELVRQFGGNVIGVSVICNRGDQTVETLQVPQLVELSKISMEVFDPDACPECEQGVPIIVDVGHGDKFALDHPTYHGGFDKLLG